MIAKGHLPQILSGESSDSNELRVATGATLPQRECVQISGTDYPTHGIATRD